MHTMLIRPTKEELTTFGKPDFVIYNAGEFPANRLRPAWTPTQASILAWKTRSGHPRHRIRGRNEERRLYRGELLCAEARVALDALLCDSRPKNGCVVAAFRSAAAREKPRCRPIQSVISLVTTNMVGRMTAFSTSKAAATRRRSTSRQNTSRTSFRRCASEPCSRTWSSMTIAR